MLHKIDKNKKVAPKLIFFNKFFFRKDQIIYVSPKGHFQSEMFLSNSVDMMKILQEWSLSAFCHTTSCFLREETRIYKNDQ